MAGLVISVMHAADAASPALAQWSVRGAWESAAIGLFFAGLRRAYTGLSPRVSVRLWTAGFVLAAAIPFLHWQFVSAATGAAQGAAAAGPALLSLGHGWAVCLCAVWAVLSAAALFRLAAGVLSLRQLVRRAQPASATLQALYRQVVGENRRAAHALVMESSEVAAPSACGLPRATVLMPHGLAATLLPHELTCVLRHEAEHLARRDDWWALLTRLTRAVLPLSLAMPYLERGMARSREMVCDDAALAGGVSRPGYAACLARMAEQTTGRGLHGLAPGLGGERSQLAQRVTHILESAPPMGMAGRMAAAVSGCLGIFLVAAMAGAPGLLAFRAPASAAAAMAHPSWTASPHNAAPALTAQPTEATIPLLRMHAASWTAPKPAGEQPVLAVASAAQATESIPPSGTPESTLGNLHVRQASAIRTEGTAQAPDTSPAFYLVWRRSAPDAPAGVLVVVPAVGSTPSRFFFLSI